MNQSVKRALDGRQNRFAVRLTKMIAAGALAASMVPTVAYAEAQDAIGGGSSPDNEITALATPETGADALAELTLMAQSDEDAGAEADADADAEPGFTSSDPEGSSDAVAAQSEDDVATVNTFDELQKAVNAGGAIALGSDIEIPKGEILDVTTTVTLDLNGKTLAKNDTDDGVQIYNGGSLTLDNGTVSARSNYFFNVYDGSSLTINGGTYTIAKYGFYTRGSSGQNAVLTINGGTFANTEDSYFGYFARYSEVYVYGGKFDLSNGFAICNSIFASVPVSSGFTGESVPNYEDKNYLLTDEEYDSPNIFVWGKEGSAVGPEMTTTYAAIYGNFWFSETDITINSGSIISTEETAIYHPQQGTFTMNGGYLQGESAIEAKMGHFTFNGGYIVGTGEASEGQEPDDILGGTTSNGAAIKLELGFYGARDTDAEVGARGSASQQASENTTYHLPRDNDFSLNITGGVFVSENNAPVTATNWNMCSQDVSYSIAGGRFSSFPKTIEKVHGEGDSISSCGIPMCETVLEVNNYLYADKYSWAPAAYYDGVALDYGFEAADAPYYASMADAVDDRNNDSDARAYIYYLLDNGLPQGGSIDRQLQVFYSLEDYCDLYVPSNVSVGTQGALFGYSFDPSGVVFDPAQYVLTDMPNGYALWSPAVTYDANGGSFANGGTAVTVLASVASGLFEGLGYGYVVDDATGIAYVTLDEAGNALLVPEETTAVNPEDPSWDGRTFLGWYYEDGTQFDAVSTQIKSNMTVYAKWSSPDVPVVPDEPAATPDEPAVTPDEPAATPDEPATATVKPTPLAQTGDPLGVAASALALAAVAGGSALALARRRNRQL